jgi:hypothetical protein
MARFKEFETTRALRIAMEVFWRHGYENTSLELLNGSRQTESV